MGSRPRLVHVVLQTGQVDAMRDWYCTVLNAHVVYAGHHLTFLTHDDEHHRIALLEMPPGMAERKSPATAAMHHSAWTFDSLDDLLDRYQELTAKGIEPAVPIQHGVTTSLYYRDPDGNFVELQIDDFASPDEATGYMEGPEYDSDAVWALLRRAAHGRGPPQRRQRAAADHPRLGPVRPGTAGPDDGPDRCR